MKYSDKLPENLKQALQEGKKEKTPAKKVDPKDVAFEDEVEELDEATINFLLEVGIIKEGELREALKESNTKS